MLPMGGVSIQLAAVQAGLWPFGMMDLECVWYDGSSMRIVTICLTGGGKAE